MCVMLREDRSEPNWNRIENQLSVFVDVEVCIAVFCPGLKKGMVLLAEKGHFCSRNYILRALLRAKLHFEGTFAREIIL